MSAGESAQEKFIILGGIPTMDFFLPTPYLPPRG